jgi:sporulation protein YlmC with PRC-barrel domain
MYYRYHDLIGKQVIAAYGRAVGRVADLIAERRGAALRVTGLLVGEKELIRRIGFRHLVPGHGTAARRVPWRHVEVIGEHIHLQVTQIDLDEEERRLRAAASAP